LEKLSESLEKSHNLKDEEREDNIQKLVEEIIVFANNVADIEEYFEAGEFLYAAAELIHTFDEKQSKFLYKLIIKFWENQISAYKLQAKLHEIAEIYLRIADLYSEKLNNPKSERKHILNSINYLKQESKLLEEFNETRKLSQNYENIAELYLKINDCKRATRYYAYVIEIAQEFQYFDLLSYSYQQIASCFQELDDYNKSKDIILEGIEYFSQIFEDFDKKNDYLTIAQISQVLRKLYKLSDNEEQFINYSKNEASAYINLAERLEKKEMNFQKIARYYRGAALCYQEINDNLIESASCFVLAGNYSEKAKDFNEAATNFFNAAVTFKELNNLEMAYKHFVKAGDNYWKVGEVNDSTECYLNVYDIAVEGNLEYDRYGIFNQIVKGLNIIAKEGLKNKQFYTSATLILESIKFYQQLDTAKDFLVNEMVRNVYKYYYRAANLQKIGYSHIVQSYVLAAISSILNGKIKKALEILSEIESDGNTVKKYKELVKLIIKWVSEGKEVEFDKFPYDLQRIIQGSEEIMYLLKLFRGYKIAV
jgi:tetratricopeptide (TPR) repeat protein